MNVFICANKLLFINYLQKFLVIHVNYIYGSVVLLFSSAVLLIKPDASDITNGGPLSHFLLSPNLLHVRSGGRVRGSSIVFLVQLM